MGYTPVSGRLHTRYSPVRRSPSEYCYPMLPLDLHVLSLSLAFILSQDQTLHSNKNFKKSIFRSVIISVEFLLGLALAVFFQTFQYLKELFCFFCFSGLISEAKADAKINTFIHSLQIFLHFFSNFFFETSVEEIFTRFHLQR